MLHVFQGVKHLFGVTTFQIAAPAAIHKQGVASDQVVFDLITAGAWCVTGGVQQANLGLAQSYTIAAVVQTGTY